MKPNPADARKRPDTSNLTHENAARLLFDEGFEPSMEAALDAVDREREKAHLDTLSPEAAAAYLVTAGIHKTTEDALAAIYEERGIISPRIARVFADLGPIETALLNKVAAAESVLKEHNDALAKARSRPTSLLNAREGHRSAVEAKRAALRVVEEKSALLTARRVKAGEALNRKLRQGFTWENVVDAGAIVAGLDVAAGELAKMLEAARLALGAAERERDAFETAHAKELEPVTLTRK